jgi:hypothetical protein
VKKNKILLLLVLISLLSSCSTTNLSATKGRSISSTGDTTFTVLRLDPENSKKRWKRIREQDYSWRYFTLEAAEYSLTNEFFKSSSEKDLLELVSFLDVATRPLPYEGEKVLKYTIERDEAIEKRVNSNVNRRGHLVLALIQILDKYKDKYPSILTDEVLEGLRLTAMFDALTQTRRLAALGFITFSKDPQQKKELLNYIESKDGHIIFHATDRGSSPEYEFIEADTRNGDFVLKLPIAKENLHSFSQYSFRNCEKGFLAQAPCFSGAIHKELLTVTERDDLIYDRLNSLLPQIDERIKEASNPESPEIDRLLREYEKSLELRISNTEKEKEEYIEKRRREWKRNKAEHVRQLYASINSAKDQAAEDRYIRKIKSWSARPFEFDCQMDRGVWGDGCARFDKRIAEYKKTLNSLSRESIPGSYVRELEEMREAVLKLRLSDHITKSVNSSNGITVLYSNFNRDLAKKWQKELSDITVSEGLSYMMQKGHLSLSPW